MIYLQNILNNKQAQALADQAMFSGSSFMATFLAARLLSASDFGFYAGIVLALYLLISISNALIIQPFQVTSSHVVDKKVYSNFVFFMQLGILICIILAVLILKETNVIALHSFQRYTLEIGLLAFSFLLHDFLRKFFLAEDRVLYALWLDSVAGISQLFLLALAFVSGEHSLSATLYFVAFSYLAGISLGIYLLKPSFQPCMEWRNFLQDHLRQGKWLFLTAVTQWWASNLFIVASGIFLGPLALGAFRLVQSLFGILNILLQSYENYALPQAVRLSRSSIEESKYYLRNIGIRGAFVFGSVLLGLFLFSEPIIQLAGGDKYIPYAFVVKGMSILYFIIFTGYPIRMAIRMMMMNNIFFIGYAISFAFSLVTFNFLLREWQLWGAIIGLIANQLILILFWQYCLAKNQFILWR